MNHLKGFIKWLVDTFSGAPSHALQFVRWILRAENTTTGRVNLILTVFAGIIGAWKGGLFTGYGLLIVGMLIVSACLADRTHRPQA